VQTAAYQAAKDSVAAKASGLTASELCLDALKRQFPQQPVAELLEHQRWIDMLRFCQRKARELQLTQTRERRILAAQAREAISKSRGIMQQRMMRAAEHEQLQWVRLELTTRLLEMKQARLVEMRARDVEEAAAAAKHKETHRREIALQEALRQRAKSDIAKFRREQCRLEAEAARAQEAAEAALAEQQAKAAVYVLVPMCCAFFVLRVVIAGYCLMTFCTWFPVRK